MRLAAALLLLVVVAPTPELRYFAYQRNIGGLPATPGQACLALDAGVFAHAAPHLADLRLYRDGIETPYALHRVAPTVVGPGAVPLLNKGVRGGQTVFDAELPESRYSDLQLEIGAHDFIDTVEVWGGPAQTTATQTKLGSYTIFDLTKQRLGRSTVLHLPESDFRYLHFVMQGPLTPDAITGLTVVRLPASQPQFVTVAETDQVAEKDKHTVVEFTVPAHVPVERVEFGVGASPAQFSRGVTLEAEALPRASADGETDGPADASPRELNPTEASGHAFVSEADPERYPRIAAAGGGLLRVHSVENGHRIDEERLAVPAPFADFDAPAKWTVEVDDGDDAPLRITAVRLQMVQRELCFDAAGSGQYTLYYGDGALRFPRYDYAALFKPAADAAKVEAAVERSNPQYQLRPDARPFTERHPVLLWLALVVVIGLLGTIALASYNRTKQA
jgi:hypothetical protein